MKMQDRIYAILMILISLFFYLYSLTFTDPSAATWPKLFSIALIVLSVGLLLTSGKVGNNSEENNNKKIDFKSNKNILYIATLTIIYLIAINFTGFIITTIIFIMLIFWILEYKSKIKSIIISFSTTIILSLVFQYILRVPLPEILF